MTVRPHVVLHVAVSLDGATDGFQPDVATFYELAARWQEDVTLAGADTILAQEPALAQAPQPGPLAGGPLLAVVDGRRRVSAWDALRACGHWSDVIGLHAREGARHVDLAAALTELHDDRSADTVRVDSGGALNGALLAAGLVDEISLLVHPCTGGDRSWTAAASFTGTFAAQASEVLKDGLVWSRYQRLTPPA